jgi:hypothetical protein
MKLYRKQLLESRPIPDSIKGLIGRIESLYDSIDYKDGFTKDEKKIGKVMIRFYINYLKRDFETWEKTLIFHKLYEATFYNSDYLNEVCSQVEILSQDENVQEIDVFALQMRFILIEFALNFDTVINNLPPNSGITTDYIKIELKNSLENFENLLKVQNDTVQSSTLNLGKTKRIKLHETPEIRKLHQKMIEDANLVYAAISTFGRMFKEFENPMTTVKTLVGEKETKIKRIIFIKVYTDFELVGRNSQNEKKVFLYNLISLTSPRFPKTEEQYDNIYKNKVGQSFREYKLEVVRNLVG